MGSRAELVTLEPGTSIQFVVMLKGGELVWVCRRQPVWSAGQDKFKFGPLTT